MASRYSRYDADRRSRSPRDRSPDRFDRASHYSDGDRRRSSTEARSNPSAFQSNRDGFGDQLRREPPRGPKALIDPPSGPRGGGFAGDFRGGRGRGRGRGWPGRDDSRDRGRDRDMDYRDRYRDERSRERDRERDRDWRDSRDFRSRRSPIGRARSPTRDFRDRERDLPPGLDSDRPRRGSRDGGPPSAGSSSSEPLFGMGAPFPRGGGFIRGRGRGGRGDWPAERGRGRVPYDDRGDRYPRSRSQEGRWGRERDERDRGDRYPETDPRRDPRDERDRGDRELFRAKMEARAALENASQAKEISPPPVAPSAPAFGSVPNRTLSTGDGHAAAAGGTGKPPPTAPRAFAERPVSAGHSSAVTETPLPPAGPLKSIHDSPPIPLGPRAQQQKQQRPSSKQWINPNLKKVPESPKVMRSQSFAQQRPVPFQHGGSQTDQSDPRRPRSSDAKSDSHTSGLENRMRSHHSAEPGEITTRSEGERHFRRESIDHRREWMDHDSKFFSQPRGSAGPRASSPQLDTVPKFPDNRAAHESKNPTKSVRKRKRKSPAVGVVRFALPPKSTQQGEPSESDDEDMGDFFAMEINKTEAELSKLQKPNLPLKVMLCFMALSHGSMVRIFDDGEGLSDMVGDVSEGPELTVEKMNIQPTVTTQAQDTPKIPDETCSSQEAQEPIEDTINPEPAELEKDEPTTDKKEDDESQPKAEEMDLDDEKTRVPPKPENPTDAVDDTATQVADLKETDEPAATVAEDHQVHADQPTDTLETTESGSKPPSTPSQLEDEEDDDETESEDDAYMDIATVRQYMTTPPIDSLPDYDGPAWDKDKELLETLESDPMIDEFVAEHLRKIHLSRTVAQGSERKIYAENYIAYLEFTMSDDPVAVKSRDKFSVSAPSDANGTSTPEQKPEGRGTGRRFATERDLERVLQASMREDEERRERESRLQQEKYRSDKEAVIPDMHWDEAEKQEAQYTDRSGYMPPDRLVSAWHVLPPANNFKEEETQPFEKRYLEFPKQWGKIAEVITSRDFGTCIQFYYLMKKELNLKEKLKRQPKRRKKGGRGKQRSSALVSELGNGEPEGEETQENGDNGERRRPRRAAAPTWGFEQPPTDGESTSATATPGRRGASAAAKADQPEKVDGRKGRRKTAKDKDKEKEKDVKAPKPNQTLAAAPAPSAGKGRSRADSRPINAEFQPTVTPDPHRMPTQFDQPLPPGIQPPPFAVQQQQQQQPIQSIERPKPAPVTSITEVMAAPSLRPEPLPPPQSSMTTFNLAQPPPERKAPTQASSYWSVSEANDFPLLLRAFGSDWTAIATHMGSKTAVMVKNYFVRQKDQGKTEWEAIVQEADTKRVRGEKRPDPPQPTTGGRGRRYDAAAPSTSRPLAVAPGVDSHDPSQPKMEPTPGQPSRAQPFSSYGVPIAQAPVQQPLAQPGQQPIAMQPHAVPQPTPQTMSPSVRPLRPPLPPFGFPEREREPSQPQPQRVPLPQKAPTSQVPDLRDPRPLAAAQPMQPAHSESMVDRNSQMERMNMEKRLREQQQQQQQQQQQHQQQQQQQQQKQQLREMERELARQVEQQSMRVKQEPEAPPQHHYEPFGHHRQQPSHGGGPREPFSMTRPPSQEPSRSVSGQPYPPPVQQQPPQPMRSLLSDPSAAQSPQLAPPSSRPISNPHARQSSGPTQEPYGAGQPQPASSMPPLTPVRPPEPRKSNIMSLLNDDPPPPPKRVSEVLNNHGAGPSPPPSAQGIGRPPPGPGPPSQMRREPEPQYPPYGRTPSGGASAMPSLKPTYSASPGPSQHMSGPRGMQPDPAATERDYYRQHAFQQGHPASGTNSPQGSHRYPPPAQPSQSQYQAQGGYPSSYGATAQAPHAASPPPQYAVHSSASRSREVSQSSRDNAWPSSGHQQQPQGGGWPSQQQKTVQGPPQQQSWVGQHPSSTARPGTPGPAWPSGPPPQQQHHMSMRDERPPIYGSSATSMSQQQHSMQSRYSPATRAPEPIPPPSQSYSRYASTPGPAPPRDPRETPSRSYTPGVYDARGPPPQPQGPGYPGPDPRDMQLREARDPRDPRDPRDHPRDHPRDIMSRGLRPHEFDRHPDRYGR